MAADEDVFDRIHQLVDEEHRLLGRAPGEPMSEGDEERLRALEVQLDQCWDLLRQRRARRDAGLDPSEATARDADTVEGYQQ